MNDTFMCMLKHTQILGKSQTFSVLLNFKKLFSPDYHLFEPVAILVFLTCSTIASA